ncbi:MAG: hypothetical protein L6V88_02570 [Anaerotruncus sp.]|nr:MAG: hypothetical protein L6V88_02570 [Anaerotruncus sp.]
MGNGACYSKKLNDKFKEKKKDLEKAERKKLKEHYKRLKGLCTCRRRCSVYGAFDFFLKYFNFFGGAANHFFGTEIPKLNLVHPMGISFYTLQAVSYLTDVYRGRFKAEKNPLRISLYLSFMLTVVEGPVARWDQLGTQLNKGADFNF